jgi:hypothetical protein
MSGHQQAPESSQRLRVAPTLEYMTGHAGPSEASIWSLPVTSFCLRFFAELIHFNSNFSFAKCANTTKYTPCECVLSFSQSILRS